MSQRGRNLGELHLQGTRLPGPQRLRRRGADRRQWQHRRLTGDRRGRGRPGGSRRRAGIWQRSARRHRCRARQIRDHGDSDDSYDFSRLDGFVEELRAGHQLVMGNRFRGGILPGAMPRCTVILAILC